jgi:hypothetical protein
MPSFKDTEGREYHLKLNFGIACKIEDELGVPVLTSPDTADYNIKNCVSMAYLMCEDQILKNGLDPAAFAHSFDAEVLGDLCDAVVEAVVFFIKGQSPEQALNLSLKGALASGMAELMLENLETLQESGFFESPDSWASILQGGDGGNSEKCFMDAFQKITGRSIEEQTEKEAQLKSLLDQFMNSKH